jgi:uncharacterized protein
MSIVQRLHKKGLIKPPPYVTGGTQYETLMGSVAYGVSSDTSDCDIYGFCIPPKDMVFPHLIGEIPGFGNQIKRFQQYQEHHIHEKDTAKQWDIQIYSIIRYFQLCMDNNPNMIDSLFTHETCVLHATKLANHVRDNRRLFLHKGCWHKFKGYAYSQMHKMRIKEPDETSVRYESIKKYGYDVKFAYHVVRLLNEVEQIMIEGDLDLMRNNEQLKSIRRGEWTIEQIEEHFFAKEKQLEEVYASSSLQYSPDETKIKRLLLEVLEERYGSLDGCIQSPEHYHGILREIQRLVEKV